MPAEIVVQRSNVLKIIENESANVQLKGNRYGTAKGEIAKQMEITSQNGQLSSHKIPGQGLEINLPNNNDQQTERIQP